MPQHHGDVDARKFSLLTWVVDELNFVAVQFSEDAAGQNVASDQS